MKVKLVLLIILIAIIAGLFLLPEPEEQPTASQNTFALGPVNVFNGTEVLPLSYVIVIDGVITGIQPRPPGGEVIDGKNAWLLPGLIDAHVHVWGDALERQLAHGVTTVIDMFGHPSTLQKEKELRDQFQISRSATMYGAGYLVTGPKGHGTQFGIQVPVMNGAEDAKRVVAERIDSGSDFIKAVYTSPTAVYEHAPSISLEELEAVIRAGHERDQLVVVHVSDHQSALDAVQAGADGLVHSFFDKVASDQLLSEIKQRDTFVIPTLTFYEGMLRGTSTETLLLNNPEFEISAQAKQSLSMKIPGQFPEHFFTNLISSTTRMHEAGIRLLVGTDAPNPNTAHGWSIVVEMSLFAEAGIPAQQILTAATAATANAFGIADRGMIASGYRADFILLERNPLEDLTALQQPQAVYKNGFKVGRER
ncbi:Imidazolonepropionase [Pseudidiomarina planktonica]|uniref:Imidazolonepropionase n=1 Tax=Pseudidiomarina planktonica TaxID=1323738 RepID=A0A1Y6EQR9_9GAMM|nr:amidohydrolase family protein [Pseudidiomarina planktonica]RUO65428.1 metal-dependent hydrolase [Pseudidiomarina planktonica]SMQ65045.1 Imidazolonepropionase [Pseudidiomarina planktonica]